MRLTNAHLDATDKYVVVNKLAVQLVKLSWPVPEL